MLMAGVVVVGCGGGMEDGAAAADGAPHTLILDGVPHSMARARELMAERDIHMVVDAQSLSEGTVHAFTDLKASQSFAEERGPRGVTAQGLFESAYYEHSNRAGYSLLLASGRSIGDLTRVNCTPYGCVNWNDRISSLEAAGNALRITLWEHTNYSGSTLTLAGGTYVSDLGSYGWNDRASSISQY
jgi:hypothetical protein